MALTPLLVGIPSSLLLRNILILSLQTTPAAPPLQLQLSHLFLLQLQLLLPLLLLLPFLFLLSPLLLLLLPRLLVRQARLRSLLLSLLLPPFQPRRVMTKECSQLARLTLSTNAIDRFAPHVMLTIAKHLTSLNFLDLSSNCLTELPPDIYRLSTLQSLYLDSNPLTSVSLRLDLMPTLSALKIANSHMSSLFVETPAQSATINLVNLNLSNCRFDQFPVDVCKLVALHELDISHNPLESLPVQLGHLALLSSLNISHCRFSEFPPVIFFLKSLTALKINHNAL